MLDKLLSAANNTGIAASLEQGNLELISDLQKLVKLANMLASQMYDFVIDISVCPMVIMQRRLRDVRKLQFYITYNQNTPVDNLVETKKECEEILLALLSDEFPEIDKIESTLFSVSVSRPIPVLTIFSKISKLFIDDFSEDTLRDLLDITDDGKYRLYMPNTSAYTNCIPFFICCTSFDDVIGLSNFVNAFNSLHNNNIKLFQGESKVKEKYVVMPLIGTTLPDLNIPYTLLTKEMLISTLSKYETENNES